MNIHKAKGFRHALNKDNHPKMCLKDVRSAINERQTEVLHKAFVGFHPADAARILEPLNGSELANFIELIGPPRALEIFEFLDFQKQKETVENLMPEALAQLFANMSPDDRTDLVKELGTDFQDRVLGLLIHKERQDLFKLLTYSEDQAGAYMTTRFASVEPDYSIRTALDRLRIQAPTKETIYYVYVVDDQLKLLGFVSLRDLIMSRPEVRVGDIMVTNIISVQVDDNIEHVANKMARYDFLALPVLDTKGRLVGIITFDDILDVIQREATEDMYKLAGMNVGEQISSSVARIVSNRLPWLFLNIGTSLLAANVITTFGGTIEKVIALAALMTVVATLGGNSGNQALTVVVRSMAMGDTTGQRRSLIILKNIAVGLINGFTCGMVIAAVSYLWFDNLWLSIIAWIAMTANQIIAGLFGSLIPMALKRFNMDPAHGSSILVTTLTDIGGFMIFLGLASLLINELMAG
jgi:magnesium transporter